MGLTNRSLDASTSSQHLVDMLIEVINHGSHKAFSTSCKTPTEHSYSAQKNIRDCTKWNPSFSVFKTLEAVIDIMEHSENFEAAIDCALSASGNDHIFSATIGQLAGAYYGYSAIPASWVEWLCKKEMILETADRLIRTAGAGKIDRLLSEFL